MKMYRDSLPEIVYVPDKTSWNDQYSDLVGS
jgi:hypothetical protein